MDDRLNDAARDAGHGAYRAGYLYGSKVAARVDVMRWELEIHYKAFCRSDLGNTFAGHAAQAKQGFIDGFAAAQNRKGLSTQALVTGPAILDRQPPATRRS